MAKVLVTEKFLQDIGDAIRTKNRSTDKYRPSEMASQINGLESGLDMADYFNGKTTEINDKNGVVTSVASKAFSSQDNENSCILTSLSLPKATSIGVSSFQFNRNLVTINLPEVTTIDASAFQGCKMLKNVTIPKVTKIGDRAFSKCSLISLLNISNIEYLGDFALCDTSLSGDLTFTKLTHIGDQCFTSSSNAITSLTLPMINNEGLVMGGSYGGVFKDLKSMRTINAPLLTIIPDGAFCGCSSLTTVNTGILTKIGDRGFSGCKQLTNIDLSQCISIGDSAFNDTKLTGSITLNECAVVGSDTFSKCANITEIKLPKVKSLGRWSFENCTNLASLVIGSQSDSKVCEVWNTPAGGTQISKGLGYIYVADSLVDSYKATNFWKNHASQIRPLSEYPETIGG